MAIWANIQQAIGPQKDPTIAGMPTDRKETQWYGLVSRSTDLAKSNLAKHSDREETDKPDKGRGGQTTSGNRRAWSLASPRGQWRTGKTGELEKPGHKVLCGVTTTITVKELMM